jgi:soluble lytic murein transglycosylase-like protein
MSTPTRTQLVPLAKDIAKKFMLDGALVCAVIEQESNWNPWSMRYEPAFFSKYVAALYTNNQVSASEAYARAMSWGLMQVMGQVARENGVNFTYLSALCDPEAGISVGCTVLVKKLEAEKNDVIKGLLRWNGGTNPNYAAQVLARMKTYQ